MLFCKCTFLDDTDVDVKIGKEASGNDLFNRVCDYLGIKNRNLLGLVHKTGTLDSSSKWWIRTDKLLRKQMKGKCQVWTFSLLLKLYPKRNFDKLEEITRYEKLLNLNNEVGHVLSGGVKLAFRWPHAVLKHTMTFVLV